MAERHSWAVGAVAGVGQVDELDARLTIGGLIVPAGTVTSHGGMFPAASTPGAVTATTPTPNGEVQVAPFRGAMQSTRPGGGGVYIICLDAIKTIDVLGTAPADPANPRIDLIVFQQSDTYHGDAASDFVVRHVVGTPAVTPVDPDPTAGGLSPDYILKARITVAAGATTIDQADIENLDPGLTVAVGGLLPVPDESSRDAIVNPYDGMPIARTDRDWIEVYDGTAWRVHGVAICTSTADRDDAITHPRTGQLAQTTDTDILWQYDGGSLNWRQMARADSGVWTSYAPSWTTSGTQPSIGNGSLTGEWCRVGDMIRVRVTLTLGSTTTVGTGGWSFSTPVAAEAVSAHNPWPIWCGSGLLRDVSAFAWFTGTSFVEAAGGGMGVIVSAGQVSGSPGVPFTWASGDHLTLEVAYRAA